MKHTKTINIASGIFIILFTYTAINKLIDYPTFRIALVQSPLLEQYASIVAVAVPAAELIIVAMLVISVTRKTGLIASLLLMVVFTSYIGYLLLFSNDLPCNCGGILKALSWKSHLVVNILLVALAGWALFDVRKYKNTIAIARKSRTPV